MAFSKKEARKRGLRKMKVRLKIAKDANDGDNIIKYKHRIEKCIDEYGDQH